MNCKTLVKWSNMIGVVAVAALVYWVFVFIMTSVFELRIFQERITETFSISVLGILAIMAGTLVVNVMFNLTRIAERHDQDVPPSSPAAGRGKWLWFVLAFPVIAGLLFAGDHLSAQRKKKMLIGSVQAILASSPGAAAGIPF